MEKLTFKKIEAGEYDVILNGVKIGSINKTCEYGVSDPWRVSIWGSGPARRLTAETLRECKKYAVKAINN